MPTDSKLLEFNPHLSEENGIFRDSRDRFRDSQLENSVQIAVADAFASADDLSLFSLQLEQLASTDEVRYELDPLRFGFLLSLDLSKVKHVLDITEDLGGATHFLASYCTQVDSIKVDRDRARLSAQRCAELNNVSIATDDLNELKFAPKHYDLIVIGDLPQLQLDHDQRITLFARLRDALSDQGVLVIANRNSAALATQFDASASQGSTVPFASLYRETATLDTYAGMNETISSAGFEHVGCFASFSTGDQFRNLFADDYLKQQPTANNHFYRLGAIQNPLINEYLLFSSLDTKLMDAASGHLFVAGHTNDSTTKLIATDFAHYPGSGRLPVWRTVTEKSRFDSEVTKRRLHAAEPDSNLLTQNLQPQMYVEGSLLVAQWLHSILNNDDAQFAEQVDSYANWLKSQQAELGDQQFTAIAYDLLPFNVIVSDSGVWQAIDPEWQLNTDYSHEFVLFRALLWFAFENKALLQPLSDRLNLPTLAHFIVHWHPGFSVLGDLTDFVQLEESVQAQIDSHFKAGSVGNAIHQSFSAASGALEIDTPVVQLQWSDATQNTDSANAQFVPWAQQGEATVVAVPAAKPEMNLLRIDPMSSQGLFCLHSLQLKNSAGKVLLSVDNPSACLDLAELQNIEIADDGVTGIAVNDDPYMLFSFADEVDLNSVSSCELKLTLEHSPAQLSAMSALLDRIDQQSRLLSAQANRLNEYKAAMEFKSIQLEDAREHRDDLNSMINEHNRRQRPIHSMQDVFERTNEQLRRTIRDQNHKLRHLNEQLLDQIRHNHEVDRYLMQRPSTRIKGFVSRIVRRITGRTAPPTPAAENPPSDDKPGGSVALQNIDATEDAQLEAAQLTEASDADVSDQEQQEDTDQSSEKEPELLGQNKEDYQLWISQNSLSEQEIEAAKREIDSFSKQPVFSILVPVYNTDPEYLIPMIRSVQAQIYPHWQLVLVDDCSPKPHVAPLLEEEAAKDDRITIHLSEINQGIALTSNVALSLATGDYIALLDHDDELSIDALYENAKVINQRPDAGLIYSDEDKMDLEGNRLEPYFKPDYSPDLLDTNNYICHLTVMKKAVADRIGGFREGIDGSQDHDIILRAINETQQIVHIPKILYHWRKIPGSTAVTYDSKSYAWEAGRQAVEDCIQQRELKAHVEFGSLKGTYRVYREIRGEPLISIIIPFKDKPELLDACIGSILRKTEYKNFEIVGVNNSSEDPATFARMKAHAAADPRVRFVDKDMPFNFSAICNYGVEQAKGEYVLLLNNDITIDGRDWLERLLEHAQRAEVGAVGGKLLYPDGRIQHAGIVVGMVGAAGHPHKFFPDNHIGYHGRLHMVYNVSAVTGAMLMVRKDKYQAVGGLNEEHLAVAYNDVDFCLKLMQAGYSNLFTPHARAIHHESISRGYEDTPEKLARLKAEQAYFLSTWSEFLAKGDPYYNPNLSLLNESFSLKFKEERDAQSNVTDA